MDSDTLLEGHELEALLYLVPPATACDRLGELSDSALQLAFDEAVIERLVERGVIACGYGPTSAPHSVVTFYEEFVPRTTLMQDAVGRGCSYEDVVSITEVGWRCIEAALARGRTRLPEPRWHSNILV